MSNIQAQCGKLTGTIRPQGVLKGKISKPLIVGDDETVYILRDDDGNELVGVLTDVKPVVDATANDIREGVLAITEEGLTEGTKVIPSYITSEGYVSIMPGQPFIIKNLGEYYDFTKLQALFCVWAGTLDNSVAADKVAINESVYFANSTELLATVVRDSENEHIDFVIVNEGKTPYILRYFTFKEIY